MTQNDTKPGWKQQTGLAEDRTYARLYPTETQKSTWMEEAEEQGFSSLSRYLIHLVQEARAREQLGPAPSPDSSEIDRLQQRVEELEDKLKQERQKNTGKREISDADVLEEFLTDKPQSLTELLQNIVESGVLDEFVRKRVEDQLYFMSQHDDVIYDRQGGGWRLPRDNGGGQS